MNKYYAVLGLPPGASKDEVRRKYRKLVLLWHPDKNPSPEAHAKFIAITEAYDILMGERTAPRTKTNYAKSTYAYAKPKTPEEQRRERRMRQSEALRQKFNYIREQHMRAPDSQGRKEAYYRKVYMYFTLAGITLAAAFLLPFTVLGTSAIIVTIPLGIGTSLGFFWRGGRIKMRVEMIYSGRTDYTLGELQDFFHSRSGTAFDFFDTRSHYER